MRSSNLKRTMLSSMKSPRQSKRKQKSREDDGDAIWERLFNDKERMARFNAWVKQALAEESQPLDLAEACRRMRRGKRNAGSAYSIQPHWLRAAINDGIHRLFKRQSAENKL